VTARKALVDYGINESPYARWPADHVDEKKRSRLITREKVCVGGKSWGCQNVVHQTGISKTWLARLSESHRAGFLENCELDAQGSAWLPKSCTRCSRIA
jgi:hypothetical protein